MKKELLNIKFLVLFFLSISIFGQGKRITDLPLGTNIDTNDVFVFVDISASANGITKKAKWKNITDTIYAKAITIPLSSFNNDAGFITDADAGIKTTYSATEPISKSTGDMWFDTSGDNYVMKRYNGATWDLVSVYMDGNGLYAREINAGQVTAGTFTGLTFQTAASGQRVVIDGATNKIIFYDPAGSVGTLYGSGGNIVSNASWFVNSTSIVGLYAGTTGSGGIGLEGEGGGNPAIGVSGKALGAGINRAIYGDAQNGTANYAGYFNNGKVYIKNALEVGSERLIINSSGQLTKVDNTAASGNIGYVLASDGTSFTPTSGYATKSWVTSQGYSTFNGAYSSLSGIPSTFAPSSHKHLLGDLWDGTYYVTTEDLNIGGTVYRVLVLDY